MNLYDAHNHLQDERFGAATPAILAEAKETGVVAMVVNGSCEQDWDAVAGLARADHTVIPSYGVHPWYHAERSPRWLDDLRQRIAADPRAAVGEIGLDRWKRNLPHDEQEAVFLAQWKLAAEFNRPASIHCLKTWGRLFVLLREYPAPACGFILHSYGGPREMVGGFAELGAYFSFPGYYLHERKAGQREVFRAVPKDRLLIETDAPDQRLPDDLNEFPCVDRDGAPVNHPANLRAVYRGLASALGGSMEDLVSTVEANFLRLFPRA
ncbi:MAG TPA: TatD family hydrolase [Kiritimatiellia bacterium]|nr:TatD family hydrolase [Kiritimatiellia bacterium]HMO99572.1 TatD family hydrolase [Kiritimatiellia bacterium]HMP97553.1 TatD family hydrolase [Kiritimatiellia bacterium]